jgi:hypothetical protein
LSVILSSLTVGIVGKYFLGYKKENVPRNSLVIPRDFNVKVITDAVQSSAISMLTVCAYVVFFSALGGTVNLALEHFHAPALLKASVFGFLELSSGVSAASALPNTVASALLCAFAAGWGGISVHCQMLSVCSGSGIRLRSYLFAKIAQGLLSALLFGCLLHLFPSAMIPGGVC